VVIVPKVTEDASWFARAAAFAAENADCRWLKGIENFQTEAQCGILIA
jgi:hypothetical protein